MKRFLLGLLILALLLGGSWLIHQSLRFIHEPIAEDLEQAAQNRTWRPFSGAFRHG